MIIRQSNGLLTRTLSGFSGQESISRKLSGNFFRVSVGLFSFFLLLSLLKVDNYTLDETVFHYPNLLNFYYNGWDALFNDHYSAANTPLPYFIVAILAKLFSPSLVLARIVTALISFATFLLFVKLLESYAVSKYFSFSILLYPYFFVNAFVFYTINYGLFFLALALLLWQKNEKEKQHSLSGEFLTGLAFSMAVLCQQFFLVIPFAIIAYRGCSFLFTKKMKRRQSFQQLFLSNLLLAVPLILPFALFFYWGGLTHPNFRSHTLAFYPSTVVAILFVTGFYFSPYIFFRRKKIKSVEAIASLSFSILLVTVFKPVFSDFQGPGLFTGLVFHLITIPGEIHPFISSILMTALTSLGVLVLVELVKSLKSRSDFALITMAAGLLLAYSFNTQIGERHLSGLMMILFLLLLPRMKETRWLYPAAMTIAGIGYFAYWYFFKFSGA